VVVYGYYYSLALLAGAAIVTYLTNWYYAILLHPHRVLPELLPRSRSRHPSRSVAVSPADGKSSPFVRKPTAPRVSIF
jgi:hypothetical protein